MVFAPVLQDVAARISGTEPRTLRDEPQRWAYALREAVSLVAPDWVVTHHDLELEVEAVLANAETLADVADVPLDERKPTRSALELTETLAGLYPGGVVAASITGPASMATRLARSPIATPAGEADLLDVIDACGDALAELAAAHVDRGARRVVVWESACGAFAGSDVEWAHAPIVRRLETLGVPAVLCAGSGVPVDGHAVHASPSSNSGAALVPPDAFPGEASVDLDSFEALWGTATAIAGADGVVLTDGPIPGECAMTVLARLGRRSRIAA
jgi:hypothetical protein